MNASCLLQTIGSSVFDCVTVIQFHWLSSFPTESKSLEVAGRKGAIFDGSQRLWKSESVRVAWHIPRKGYPLLWSTQTPLNEGYSGKYLLTDLVNAVKDSGQKAVLSGTRANWRSRLAANPRHAWMSYKVRSGNSLRISCWLIPEARYSSTSVTVMRVPRMQGCPLRLSGSRVILDR